MISIEYNFSPSFKLISINPENVIEAFKERIEEYYFRPLEILLSEKDFGFAATTILASLIDILSKTESHDIENYNNREKYKTWLVNNLEFDPDVAEFFYDNFRCGLLHAGCIESGGQISFVFNKLFWEEKGHLIFNPRRLFEIVKKIFDIFIENEDSVELFEYLNSKVSEIN